MLVNFDKNLIFLRPYFCGSTSTEFSLSLFIKNKRDIITPVSFPEEIRRRKLKVYPQNFGLKYFEKIYNLSVFLKNRKLSDFFTVKGKTVLLKNHSNLEDLINIKKIDFTKFCKVSIKRHPYDKALSAAKWHLVKRKYLYEGIKVIPSKDEIVESLNNIYKNEKLSGINNWSIYSLNGKYIIDLMIEYDDLDNIDKILSKFNFGSFKLPQLKKHYNKDYVSRSMIPNDIKKYVQQICSEEFKQFSYKI